MKVLGTVGRHWGKNTVQASRPYLSNKCVQDRLRSLPSGSRDISYDAFGGFQFDIDIADGF